MRVKIEINWREVLLPALFLVFCICYTIQILHIRFLPIAFSSLILIFMVPVLLVIIIRNIEIIKTEKEIKGKSDSFKKPQPTLFQVIIKYIINILNIKKIRFIILFLLSFSIILYLFGFMGFILFFTIMSLYLLGVKKIIHAINISIILTILFYYIFGVLFYVYFPKGIIFNVFF